MASSVGPGRQVGGAATDGNRQRSQSLASYFEGDAADEFLRLAGLKKSELKDYFQQLDDRELKVEILVTGRTGTGKSTLVNALVGRKVAEEGHNLKPKTKRVTDYSVTTEESYS